MTLKLLRRSCACLILAAVWSTSALAQTEPDNRDGRARAPQAASDTAQARAAATADEDFELNIGERRITEADYEASLSVAVGEEATHGLNLRVGTGVGASQIDVLLRNVRGRVRFRATLEQILRLLDGRRNGSPLNTTSAPGTRLSLPLK